MAAPQRRADTGAPDRAQKRAAQNLPAQTRRLRGINRRIRAQGKGCGGKAEDVAQNRKHHDQPKAHHQQCSHRTHPIGRQAKRGPQRRDAQAQHDKRPAHPQRKRQGRAPVTVQRRCQNDGQHRQHARVDQRQKPGDIGNQ